MEITTSDADAGLYLPVTSALVISRRCVDDHILCCCFFFCYLGNTDVEAHGRAKSRLCLCILNPEVISDIVCTEPCMKVNLFDVGVEK